MAFCQLIGAPTRPKQSWSNGRHIPLSLSLSLYVYIYKIKGSENAYRVRKDIHEEIVKRKDHTEKKACSLATATATNQSTRCFDPKSNGSACVFIYSTISAAEDTPGIFSQLRKDNFGIKINK
jgi:hypothetical protein